MLRVVVAVLRLALAVLRLALEVLPVAGALKHGRLGGVLPTGAWGAAAPRLLAPTVEALQTGPRYTRPSSLFFMASKVVLLGAFGVGKTCLLRQFVWGTFETKHTA
eukprot:COSAG01_NODE_35549_length_530_cov_1.071926_1_plen_105_part_10